LTLLKWKKGVPNWHPKSKLTLFICLMHIPDLIVHIIINKKSFPKIDYRLIAK